MTVWTYNFEAGSAGASLALTDTPSAGDTQFNLVTIGSGATLTYDTTHAHTGSQALRITTTAATIAQSWAGWDGSIIGTPGQLWYRLYAWFPSLPLTGISRLWAPMFGGSQGDAFAVAKAGQLTQVAQGPVNMDLNATGYVVPVGQWVRYEGTCFASATVGWGESKVWGTSPESAGSPDETRTTAATFNTQASFNATRVGQSTNIAAGIGPYWIDDFAVSDTGYIGPLAGTTPKTGTETESGTEGAPVWIGVNDAVGGAI